MTSRNSSSITETQQLLQHALDSTYGLSKQELARKLVVPPPRISEGLRGDWNLSDDQRKKLVEKFGQPRGAPGKYLRAGHLHLDRYQGVRCRCSVVLGHCEL